MKSRNIFDAPFNHSPAIWHPHVPREGFAIALFRRRFTLDKTLRNVTLWISASERFEFFADGKLIARGPSRSDPLRWGVVKVILPRIKPGRHVFAARVAHFGEAAGIGQLGGPGFFLLHAEDFPEFHSDGRWRCFHERAREPITQHAWGGKPPYYVVGAGERIRGAGLVEKWEQLSFDDNNWLPAQVLCPEAADIWGNLPLAHRLQPDPLPQMERIEENFSRVADAPEGLRLGAERWMRGGGKLKIGPRRKLRIVLDRGEPTNAFLSLHVAGGRGAKIQLVSAEAPYRGNDRHKGNRDEIGGKKFFGHRDEFLPDGGTHTFAPLWFRAFRYLEITIRTAAEPLVLEKIRCEFTGYPLTQRTRLALDATALPDFQKMWDVSWRTIRLCAHETFFDCPHYEQAQFPGDTRVQAIYHYLVANDDRLARKAIDDFHASRLPDGMLQCRWPSRRLQILPTFALYWIGMLHDFRIYRGDPDFLRPYLHAAREILCWFQERLRTDGMLQKIEHAPFIDWAPAFTSGNAPQDNDGGSAILTLLFARACDWMADLEKSAGFPELQKRWKRLRNSLVAATLRQCWDEKRGLLRDTSGGGGFSQHAQIEAILAGAWSKKKAREIMHRVLDSPDAAKPGTHYYRFYLAQALKACKMREHFFPLLENWRTSLHGTGLHTWPESDQENSRSDCHAWSVTPAIEFVQTVLGVEPHRDAIGFDRITFHPEPGPLASASGTIATPLGKISVKIQRQGGKIKAKVKATPQISLPTNR